MPRVALVWSACSHWGTADSPTSVSHDLRVWHSISCSRIPMDIDPRSDSMNLRAVACAHSGVAPLKWRGRATQPSGRQEIDCDHHPSQPGCVVRVYGRAVEADGQPLLTWVLCRYCQYRLSCVVLKQLEQWTCSYSFRPKTAFVSSSACTASRRPGSGGGGAHYPANKIAGRSNGLLQPGCSGADQPPTIGLALLISS